MKIDPKSGTWTPSRNIEDFKRSCDIIRALEYVANAAAEVAKRFTPSSPDDMYALVDALKKLNEARNK
jgi:hypothetical protein